MNRLWPLLFFPMLLATGPSPLVVGVVRDQTGAAIAHAQVALGSETTLTAADGTFALAAAPAGTITIRCSYCEPVRITAQEGPIVAIVRRYTALAQRTPTDADVTAVPYARADSIVTLRPFRVLNASSRLLPGPQISDHGANAPRLLFMRDGVPAYATITNVSPFLQLPAFALTAVQWHPLADVPLFGVGAASGSVAVQSTSQRGTSAVASAGSPAGYALATGDANVHGEAAVSEDAVQDDVRRSVGIQSTSTLPDAALNAGLNVDALLVDRDGASLSAAAFSSGATYSRRARSALDAAVFSNGGNYAIPAHGAAYVEQWKDTGLEVERSGTGAIAPFATAGFDSQNARLSSLIASMPVDAFQREAHIDAGIRVADNRFDVQAALVASTIGYGTTAAPGQAHANHANLLMPTFAFAYRPAPRWEIEAQAIDVASISPFDVSGNVNNETHLARGFIVSQTIRYTTLSRLRGELTHLDERASGANDVHSGGAAAVWQVAPRISMRASVFDVMQAPPTDGTEYLAMNSQLTTSVGSYWATYEGDGMRADVLFRRDLLDGRADPHVDASLNLKLGPTLRTFLATERYAGRRETRFGLRMTPW